MFGLDPPIKTFGGDDLGINLFLILRSLLRGQFIASCLFIAKPTKIDALLSWASSRSLGPCYSHRFPGLQRLRVSSCSSQGIQLHSKARHPKPLNLPRRVLCLSLSPFL
jgi:hypothetical protein